MKIKNCIVCMSMISMAFLSTAFIAPQPSNHPESENGGQNFAEFLSHFEKTTLPFRLELNKVDQYQTLKSELKQKRTKPAKRKVVNNPLAGTRFIPEVANGRFSRMGPPQVEPVARFYPNEKMIAVIYGLKQRIGNHYNKSFAMMVYDLKGNIIAPKQDEVHWKRSFNLGHTSTDRTISCFIDAQGHIWKNTYENVWEKDIKINGLNNNVIVDFKLVNTDVFKLKKNGIFEQLKNVPSDGRASLN